MKIAQHDSSHSNSRQGDMSHSMNTILVGEIKYHTTH